MQYLKMVLIHESWPRAQGEVETTSFYLENV